MCQSFLLNISLDDSDDGFWKKRHPVQQGYLTPHLLGEQFLKKEGDVGDKVWDEILLSRWERECNDGRPWEDSSIDPGKQL